MTSTACTIAYLTCILYPLYFGKSKKVIFQQYYPFIQIMYVISEENKLLPPLSTTPEKCHPTTL